MSARDEIAILVMDEGQDDMAPGKLFIGKLGTVGNFLAKEKPGDCRTFHFCNKGEATRFKMAEKIRDFMGLKGVEVDHTETIPDRPAIRPAYGVLATGAYEKFFGTGIRGWEEGLREYVQESGTFCAS